MNDLVLKKVDRIVSLISNEDSYVRLKEAEIKMENNPIIIKLLNEKRELQKNAVNLKYLNKKQALKSTDEAIKIIDDKLALIPIYSEYKLLLSEVDDLIQDVIMTIEDNINTFS